MKVFLIGLQHVDFINSDGEKIHGVNLWFSRPFFGRESETWVGEYVGKRWVNVTDPLYAKASTLVPGNSYSLDFQTDGRHSYLLDIVSC